MAIFIPYTHQQDESVLPKSDVDETLNECIQIKVTQTAKKGKSHGKNYRNYNCCRSYCESQS